MGVNYLICTECGDTFADVSGGIRCSNCEGYICPYCEDEATLKFGVVDLDSDMAVEYGEEALLKCADCTAEESWKSLKDDLISFLGEYPLLPKANNLLSRLREENH